MYHFFWREYLTLKSCKCSTGATGLGSPAAGLAAGLAALVVEGLALGTRLAAGLQGAPTPCGKQSEPVQDGEGGFEGGSDVCESESEESVEASPKYSVSNNLAHVKLPGK